MIAQAAAEIEDDLYAGEVPGGVLDRAVGRVIVRDVQLRQLDLRIHHQRVRHVPDEHQVLGGVRHCKPSNFTRHRPASHSATLIP